MNEKNLIIKYFQPAKT